MFYKITVEDNNKNIIIGSYRLDRGSKDFHLDNEKRIWFDYIDFNKYQACVINISDNEYKTNINKDVQVFTAKEFEAYSLDENKRIKISGNFTAKIEEAK